MLKVDSVLPLPLPDAANGFDSAPVLRAPSSRGRRHAGFWRDAEARDEASAAFCRLAAQLHQTQQTRALTTILIASALPDEGKSLTAANLALALSGAYGKRVSLIDADLRRPSLHRMFGTSSSPGLHDCLAGAVQVRPARISHTLTFLPAGSPQENPLEILSSSRLRALIAEQAQRCDWVIFDAPPLAACPDAGLLASLVDGVVLVVRAGHTPLPAVESAVQSLGRDRIVGVILNRSTSSTARARYYPGRQA
jgi:capsular exopolysaccharide synthesis family protein